MTVQQVLEAKGSQVVTVSADAPLREAVGLLVSEVIGAVMVLDGEGRLAGVLSERDVVEGLSRWGDGVLGLPVSSVMRKEVPTCSPTDSMLRVMALMSDRRVRHVPVIAEGRLTGVLSVGDAVKYRINEVEAEAQALREYIAS